MNLHRALKLLELQLLLLELLLLLNLQLLPLDLQLRCAQVVVLLLLRAHLAQELRAELPVARPRRQERPLLLTGRVVGARAVNRRGGRHGHRGDRHGPWHHGHHGRSRGQRERGVVGVVWWERRGGGSGAHGGRVWRDDDAFPDENEGND